MKTNLIELERCLGYRFKNLETITEALTHRSYTKIKNNERLEFLGDAVLDLVVGEYLFFKFPHVSEGELSKLRASLVSEKGFQELACSINLGEYIYISAAEENNNGREKASILSNAFEAIMGAIYLESNLEKVKEIITKLLEKRYPQIDMQHIFKDYKTTLQELTQAHFGVIPDYVLLRATGPDHQKEFEISVVINKKEFSRAKGSTKKEAEQKSAKIAIEIIQKEMN
ncbi:MAG: ribonuclease III [Campylobacteraceae bacterium]|jgi:ribonuclease-3|nr:ribonuclease III [Campylobacteraceae bacterium]